MTSCHVFQYRSPVARSLEVCVSRLLVLEVLMVLALLAAIGSFAWGAARMMEGQLLGFLLATAVTALFLRSSTEFSRGILLLERP
ncbi:MAG: hypothetical protein KGO50_04960 [Myxococcales bacterium]|nr:hypothetical protein [Myxococcales bacterium]